VCTKPKETTHRRKLRRFGYVFKGGESCRSCSNDNFDKRRRQLTNYDPNWFKNQYAPSLRMSCGTPLRMKLLRSTRLVWVMGHRCWWMSYQWPRIGQHILLKRIRQELVLVGPAIYNTFKINQIFIRSQLGLRSLQ
jgi:hypothetical protein